MKHWLWYKSDGSLGGEAIYQFGFPADVDLNDEDSEDERVLGYRNTLATQPDFAGFVAYECPCPPEMVECDCCRQRHIHYYYDTVAEELKLKPTFDILVDGVLAPFTVGVGKESVNEVTTVDAPPGSTVKIRLRQAAGSPEGIPPGRQMDLECNTSPSVFQSSPVTVTFDGGGQTEEVDAVVPPQGLVATVVARPTVQKHGHVRSVRLRGWA